MPNFWTSMEDVRVGRPWTHLIPQIQLDSTHISINIPEKKPKDWQNRLSTANCREEATEKRVGRAETLSRA